jgi:ABC-2 type transport system permease protein
MNLLQIQLISFLTIIHNQIKRVFRIWSQTLLPSAVTMTLYFLIFGSLIGSQVRDIAGFSYVQYITPGLIMMTVVTNTYGQVVATFFGAKFGRSIEELLVSPTYNITIILGYVFGGLIRGAMTGLIVLGISLFFTHLTVKHIGLALLVILISSVLMSLIALINAIYARKFDDVNFVPSFVLTPLTYLGGVFFSITMLPEFWQKVAMINPLLYLINAFRYSFLGVSDVEIGLALLMSVLFTAALFFVCLQLLRKGVGLRS